MTTDRPPVLVISDPKIAAYGFGSAHPFGPDRHDVFHAALTGLALGDRVRLSTGRAATREELTAFHSPAFVDFVYAQCASGGGFLDGGDTPAVSGLAEAAAAVVGATLTAVESLRSGQARKAFVPIGGLHHAGRAHAAGFCVFNDCGVAIEVLRKRFGVRRIAYVDIDAHHGDGVYFAFESDPDLLFADLHEDGRFLYPGTGARHETGSSAARGTKLNVPLAPGAGDEQFFAAWEEIEGYLRQGQPEFFLLQCGADSLAGDPLTHLRLSYRAHEHAARRLCVLADEFAGGQVLACGGGGYNRENIATAWTAVVRAFADLP
jgi:acetoin utilization protein AcuC